MGAERDPRRVTPTRSLAACFALSLALIVQAAIVQAESQAESAADRPLVVGTAPVSGTFFPAGGALCREINKTANGRIACLVAATSGSEENLKRLRNGDLDLAVVQSDWAYHAAGRGIDADPPLASLRALFSLQPLIMTLIAGPESGVTDLTDLRGKIVSIGPAGSALAAGARLVLEGLGFAPGSLQLVEMPVDRQIPALCNGEIDAFLIAVAHPNGAVGSAVDLCAASFVPLSGEPVARLLQAFPYYGTVTIPAGLYLYNGNPVESIGLLATVVADQTLDADLVYRIVEATFDNLDDLKAQHPVLEHLSVLEMTGPGLPAPLHPGALRYFQEQGWR